jgi:hypothetical protein
MHNDFPLGLSDLSFPRLNTRKYTPDEGAGAAFAKYFWRGRVQTDKRWDESVGACGGQLGSSAKARRSLAVAIHAFFKSPVGARLEATQDGDGSQPEERQDLAAEIIIIIRRRKNPVRGFLGNIPVPTIF